MARVIRTELLEAVMENAIRTQVGLDTQNEGGPLSRNNTARAKGATRILRAHHQWTMFQAIRYALWLTCLWGKGKRTPGPFGFGDKGTI